MDEKEFEENKWSCPSRRNDDWPEMECTANFSGMCEFKECPFMFWKILIKKLSNKG